MVRVVSLLAVLVLGAGAMSAQAATGPSQEPIDAPLTAWNAYASAGFADDVAASMEHFVHDDPRALAETICAGVDSSGGGTWSGLHVKSWQDPPPWRKQVPVRCTYTSPSGTTLGVQVAYLTRQPVCPTSYNPVPGNGGLDAHGDEIKVCYPRATIVEKALGPCEVCNGSNPINAANGNKVEREVDYVGAGPFPLRFERWYNSHGASQVDFFYPAFPEQLPGYEELDYKVRIPPWHNPKLNGGRKWRHHYERAIVHTRGGDKPTQVSAYRPDGTSFIFQKSGSLWVSDPDVELRLEADLATSGKPLAWRLIDTDDLVEHYDAKGRLTRVVKRGGLSQTLSYDAAGYLASVIDDFGRALTFVRDADNRLVQVLDPAGRAITLAYDSEVRLVSVTRPDSGQRQYGYTHPVSIDALTAIVDETGAVYATFSYNGTGTRATGSTCAANQLMRT